MIKTIMSTVGRLAALGASAAAIAVVLPAPASHAGPSCTAGIYCSQTRNQSTLGVLAIRNWTCSSGTTGTASTGCVSLGVTEWINPGYRTNDGEDWDAFRVDAGYCYKVRFTVPGKDWTVNFNRSGMSTPVYVKVENYGTAFVRAQKYGSCP
ncbi:hypothetical protein [Sphaerisporangium sp. TRM90804]|uniref:hypothetical protein n=1 Tax=Sphaerisporangium sp. TRM90804 TaxID=3031113 RepID=UPI00244B5488|nr:hypothetical protein [Sphaerisporangium sp. TRM90804]MDH2425509.1 hypothetical protein [Sphaerisporangium sp. TRM90804]